MATFVPMTLSEAVPIPKEESPIGARMPSASITPRPRLAVTDLPLTPFERLVVAACDGTRRLSELPMLRGLPARTVRAILVRLVAFEALDLVYGAPMDVDPDELFEDDAPRGDAPQLDAPEGDAPGLDAIVPAHAG